GRWSDGSKEWTHEWLVRLPELHHKFGDDGEFLMEYKDFLRTWTSVERSRIFDQGWKLSSMWLNVTSRTYPCAWSFGDVSFTFSVTEDSPAAIVLSQLNSRCFNDISGYNDWSLDFVVYRKEIYRPASSTGAPSEEHYTRSYHNWFWQRSASVELDNLEAGDYVLHVRLDRRHTRKKTYYADSVEEWDVRKLSKVWTQAAISKSIAINFDPEPYSDYLPAPEEFFGGEDLNTLEEKQIALEVPQPTTASESNPALSTTEAAKPESKPEGAAKDGKDKSEGGGAKSTDKAPETEAKSEDKPGATASGPANGVARAAADGEADKEEKRDEKEDKPVIVTAAELGMIIRVLSLLEILIDFGQLKHPKSFMRASHAKSASSACLGYNICEKCMKSKPDAHDKTHKLLYIRTEEDAKKLKDQLKEGEDNTVTLGLRIYTKGESVVTISGQLRHGNILSWKRTDKR
ncbi:hypothetical protein FRC11_006491, partial [Ceratobasidium sp. 423]